MTTQTASPQRPRGPYRRRFAALRTVVALMLREMATTYGRSPGGYVWAVLEPVAGIAILSFIFSFGFRSPALGTNFPIFYATGLLPFTLFTTVNRAVSSALVFSRQLLNYPAVTFMDALIARFTVNLITQVLVTYIVFTGIVLMFDTRTVPDLGMIISSLALAAVLAFGIGVLNAYLFMAYPVYQTIWTIVTRPLFLVSGIFFVFGDVPQPFRDYLWWNPLIHVVGLMRAGFYPTYVADYVSASYVLVVSLVPMAFGLMLLRRYYRDLIND